MKLNVLSKEFFDLLFPYYCLGCERKDVLVCQDCLGDVRYVEQICFICMGLSRQGLVHFECASRMNSANYPIQLLSACGYQNQLIQDLIAGLKYDGLKDSALPCADIILKFLSFQKISIKKDWILTFVPVDQRKLNTRGFNQSELIAKELEKLLSLRVEELLMKTRATKPQMKLSRAERLQNLKDCFAAKKPAPEKVIIFDDVITTGSTLIECTKVLKNAGAKQIIWLTLARD